LELGDVLRSDRLRPGSTPRRYPRAALEHLRFHARGSTVRLERAVGLRLLPRRNVTSTGLTTVLLLCPPKSPNACVAADGRERPPLNYHVGPVCVCQKSTRLLYAAIRSFRHPALLAMTSGMSAGPRARDLHAKWRPQSSLIRHSRHRLPPVGSVDTLLVCTHSGAHVHTPGCCMPRWPATPRVFALLEDPWPVNASHSGSPDFGRHARVQHLAPEKLGAGLRACATRRRGINRRICRLGPWGVGRHAQGTRAHRPSCRIPQWAATPSIRSLRKAVVTRCKSPRSGLTLTGTHAHIAMRVKGSVDRFARVLAIGEWDCPTMPCSRPPQASLRSPSSLRSSAAADGKR
jgi:hypothetical protein